MNEQIDALSLPGNDCAGLRLHDLIAMAAHVRLCEAVRVLIALRAVCLEYDMDPQPVLGLRYSSTEPTRGQAMRCELAYTWMHNSMHVAKSLF